jgi:hypothetical protein
MQQLQCHNAQQIKPWIEQIYRGWGTIGWWQRIGSAGTTILKSLRKEENANNQPKNSGPQQALENGNDVG